MLAPVRLWSWWSPGIPPCLLVWGEFLVLGGKRVKQIKQTGSTNLVFTFYLTGSGLSAAPPPSPPWGGGDQLLELPWSQLLRAIPIFFSHFSVILSPECVPTHTVDPHIRLRLAGLPTCLLALAAIRLRGLPSLAVLPIARILAFVSGDPGGPWAPASNQSRIDLYLLLLLSGCGL